MQANERNQSVAVRTFANRFRRSRLGIDLPQEARSRVVITG